MIKKLAFAVALFTSWACGEAGNHPDRHDSQAPTFPAQKLNLAAAKKTVKVLELSYFPVNGSNIDPNITGIKNLSLATARQRINSFSSGLAENLSLSTAATEGSSAGSPYLNYEVIERKEFLKAIPVRYNEYSKSYRPDHFAINKSDIDFCHYVDKLGVRDIWIWMYHNGSATAPIESNMSMGRGIPQYYNRGSYGDISNSHQENDLPQCQNTYTVYGFNYDRGIPEALHNYGHQREWIYRWAELDFWKTRFEPNGTQPVGGFCGNVHFPPNGKSDYDYQNNTSVDSLCDRWKLEDRNSKSKISCTNWGCTQEGYLKWWAQRLPGDANNIWHEDRKMRNWMEFFYDFDVAVKSMGRSLTRSFGDMLSPVSSKAPHVSVYDYGSRRWTKKAAGTSQASTITSLYYLPGSSGDIVVVTGGGSHYSVLDLNREQWRVIKASTGGTWPTHVTGTYNLPNTSQVIFISDFGARWSLYDYDKRSWISRDVPTNGTWPRNVTSAYQLPGTSTVVFVSDYGKTFSVYDYTARKWTHRDISTAGTWPENVRTNLVIPNTKLVMFLH